MIAAVIQYGSMYVTYNTMLASARDAAREVAVGRQNHGNASNRAKGKRPKPARAKTLLLGITKASLQSESFISAASLAGIGWIPRSFWERS